MADIDKTLPNTRPEDELIKEQMEEVDVADELGKGPIEITDEEDGGATIDFDPNAVQMPDSGDPFRPHKPIVSPAWPPKHPGLPQESP